MNYTKEELILQEIMAEALKLLAKQIKKNKLDLKSLKEIIEQRRVDIGNLPELGQALETAYLHVHDRTEASPDNKISFQNFLNSIKELGVINVPTPENDANSNQIATTAFVNNNFLKQHSDLGAEVDLNAIRTQGIYFQKLNSNATSGLNYPVPLAGRLEVYYTQGKTTVFIHQEYTTYKANATIEKYIRNYYKDGNMELDWGAWRAIINTDSPKFTGIPTSPTPENGTNSNQIATTAFVQNQGLASDKKCVGMIADFATSNFADFEGWIFCDGRTLSASIYPLLYKKIGNKFGGIPNSTFAIPNLQGLVTACASSSEPIGKTEGAKTHALTKDELPPYPFFYQGGGAPYWIGTSYPITAFQVVQGGGRSHNNMQPTIYLAKFIYCK